jgi:hypothetical protein
MKQNVQKTRRERERCLRTAVERNGKRQTTLFCKTCARPPEYGYDERLCTTMDKINTAS